jgi:mRNA-degrading endonuclease RelE of RelBE toxin-antitoxin system
MSYKVIWHDETISSLTLLIISATIDRAQLVEDSNRITELLSQSPRSQGVHLSEGLYVADIGRFRVTYCVNDDQHEVEISSIRMG